MYLFECSNFETLFTRVNVNQAQADCHIHSRLMDYHYEKGKQIIYTCQLQFTRSEEIYATRPTLLIQPSQAIWCFGGDSSTESKIVFTISRCPFVIETAHTCKNNFRICAGAIVKNGSIKMVPKNFIFGFVSCVLCTRWQHLGGKTSSILWPHTAPHRKSKRNAAKALVLLIIVAGDDPLQFLIRRQRRLRNAFVFLSFVGRLLHNVDGHSNVT
jgi:hypothetical protein